MMQKEHGGFGDSASITLQTSAQANELVGIEGHYHVCLLYTSDAADD